MCLHGRVVDRRASQVANLPQTCTKPARPTIRLAFQIKVSSGLVSSSSIFQEELGRLSKPMSLFGHQSPVSRID
jgi:hypothetical protein